jgi:hypothetical protein
VCDNEERSAHALDCELGNFHGQPYRMYGHDECDQRVKSTVRLGNSLKHAAHQVCCYLNFASDTHS